MIPIVKDFDYTRVVGQLLDDNTMVFKEPFDSNLFTLELAIQIIETNVDGLITKSKLKVISICNKV